MATRETFAAGRMESVERHKERETLIAKVVAASVAFAARSWDHGAEIRYHVALDGLVSFEEGRR